MTGMDDLLAFVRAQLDADERDAKARRGIWPRPSVDDHGAVWLHVQYGGNAVIARYPHPEQGCGDMAALRSWAEPEGEGWHVDRVLAEVEAKRRILDELEMWAKDHDPAQAHRFVGTTSGIAALLVVVRLLAQPYAGRDGWRPEWTA